MWPLRNVGSLTDDYSLTSDWGNQWLTGGLEADVIAEAHLDAESIFTGVQRFAQERPTRLSVSARCWRRWGRASVGSRPLARRQLSIEEVDDLGIDRRVHRIAIEAFRVSRGLPSHELQHPGEARDEREMPGALDDNVFRPRR